MDLPAYAELHCLTNFSFLRGASHSHELVERAIALEYHALAITDECSLAGVVRAHEAARTTGFKLLIGSEFMLKDGLKLVLLAQNRAGYGNLAATITLGRRRADKGHYDLSRGDFDFGVPDCLALWIAPADAPDEDAAWLKERFNDRCWIAYERHLETGDMDRLDAVRGLSQRHGIPLVAAGDVHMHERSRRPLQNTLAALRLKTTVSEAGYALFPNGERHLRSRALMSRLYPAELLAETIRIADRCQFSLDELRYEYPEEVVPPGHTPRSFLRQETEQGLISRYPGGVPNKVRHLVELELKLIAEMQYEAYFLTVYDIVAHARRLGILCQGRGSAANSAVCYALHITEVDPAKSELLFGRFISKERNEPPDIDVDFEHHRREEVIQYIYGKYGRERAALTATVISYRTKSALRDVGRALGVDADKIDALTSSLGWWGHPEEWPERFAAVGLDVNARIVQLWMALAIEIRGFPRHLSQHVGGFVISRGRLDRLVPIENAAMEDRSVIQWDKDDIDVLGLMKVDVLALGMLSAIRRTLECLSKQQQRPMALQDIPSEDAAVYRMICKADTVGVFQIESRAQMSMLPRLKPKTFYDLVIEVAIVRPGPIQGDMVHPYLRRRQGLEPVTYPSPDVEEVLKRTLGVPLFQEQAMQLSMVAAGFSPGEADQLRRAMAAWRRRGGIGPFKDKLMQGMAAKGYSEAFAQSLFRQLEGFADYGFPESHAASFALLVYFSAWLKCHHPAAFLVGMLNSLPMGFYSASQLVQDARRHGVDVRPVDVTASDWESTLEDIDQPKPAVRLGLNRISGMAEAAGKRIEVARRSGPFKSSEDLAVRASLNKRDLNLLSQADALRTLVGHRYLAAWATAAVRVQGDLLDDAPIQVTQPDLAPPSDPMNVVFDYKSLGLTLGGHPMSFLRRHMLAKRYVDSAELRRMPNRKLARCAGLVTVRQRPSTSKGVIFLTLEDESGSANVIVHPRLAEQQIKELLGSQLLGVMGVLQSDGEVVHLVAKRLVDHSTLLGKLKTSSRDFC